MWYSPVLHRNLWGIRAGCFSHTPACVSASGALLSWGRSLVVIQGSEDTTQEWFVECKHSGRCREIGCNAGPSSQSVLQWKSGSSSGHQKPVRSYYSVCVRKEDSYLEKILLLLRFYRHSSVKIFTCSMDKWTIRSNVAWFQTAETVIEMF